mmetsp:Transcript_24983/g.80502  ORF Transcript_24983/g.80502 Transcript_24983/m.80502 type:complete len:265 (+) Transcript_24983:204-998(+)
MSVEYGKKTLKLSVLDLFLPETHTRRGRNEMNRAPTFDCSWLQRGTRYDRNVAKRNSTARTVVRAWRRALEEEVRGARLDTRPRSRLVNSPLSQVLTTMKTGSALRTTWLPRTNSMTRSRGRCGSKRSGDAAYSTDRDAYSSQTNGRSRRRMHQPHFRTGSMFSISRNFASGRPYLVALSPAQASDNVLRKDKLLNQARSGYTRYQESICAVRWEDIAIPPQSWAAIPMRESQAAPHSVLSSCTTSTGQPSHSAWQSMGNLFLK